MFVRQRDERSYSIRRAYISAGMDERIQRLTNHAPRPTKLFIFAGLDNEEWPI